MNSSRLTNWLPDSPRRIAVAMSGGVDSSVVAHLLAKAGHEIVGLTAWTLNGPGTCCNDALLNAGRVCEELGCDFDTVDLRAEFHHYVMDYYNRSYKAGITPNPCVECNRYVKWEAFIDYARKELAVDFVATGHYVNLARPDGEAGPVEVLRSVDTRKDQTYMLSRVKPDDLKQALFPLGMWQKQYVLQLAQELNITSKAYKESQDVCFVLDGQANYLKGALGIKKGPIVDLDTDKVVGEHEGHWLFTKGQRKGVGVAAGRPLYVLKTDPSTNTVYIGNKEHLESPGLRVEEVNWLVEPYDQPVELMVKFRYNTPPALATVEPDEGSPGTYNVRFKEPQLAVTPGQIAAFYDKTDIQLLGGGYIETHLAHQAFDPEAEHELPDLHCAV